MDDKPSNGFEMWRDYTQRHGIAAAYCICLRYLEMQAKTEDAGEKEFCRQLRSAMATEPTLTDVGVYRHTEAFAELDGSMYEYDESLRANRQCADDIGSVIDACEYGDGSVDYATALKALNARYGIKRLCLVLGCEIGRDLFGKYSDELYKWAQKKSVPESFGSMNIRTHPKYLAGLTNEVMEQESAIQKQGGLRLKSKNDFYIAFYELLALQGFRAFEPYNGNNIADICKGVGNIAYLTKNDTIEPNPHAEVDPAMIEQIREIAREAALSCGICTEKPYDETKHAILMDGAYTLAVLDGALLSCRQHPILGYVFTVRKQGDEPQTFYNESEAKQAFAIKSGLVDGQQFFTDKELSEIHAGLVDVRIKFDSSLNSEETNELDALITKIENLAPGSTDHWYSTHFEHERNAELDEGVEP